MGQVCVEIMNLCGKDGENLPQSTGVVAWKGISLGQILIKNNIPQHGYQQ